MSNTIKSMELLGHKGLHIFIDESSGMRTIIAINSTILGPALGGTRLWRYPDDDAAIMDALRLSRAMRDKAALAGVPYGGGKAVMLSDGNEADPTVRAARFRALGRAVKSLGGIYITTVDVATTAQDMVHVRQETEYVVGLPEVAGGSGDPSPMTAFGVFRGMQALVEEAFGTIELKGLSVNVQGLGHVGMVLVRLLTEAGAKVVATDIKPDVLQKAEDHYGIIPVGPEEIIQRPCDIFAPCALGEVINEQTIELLNCRIVAGAANNPLASEEHGEFLHQRGILFGVDYVINAGGLINVAQEIDGYNEAKARERTSHIYDTMKQVLSISRQQGISTQRAAAALAHERLQSRALLMTGSAA